MGSPNIITNLIVYLIFALIGLLITYAAYHITRHKNQGIKVFRLKQKTKKVKN